VASSQFGTIVGERDSAASGPKGVGSLTVSWRAHFARINWDLHSALGFWCFLFVLLIQVR